MSRKVIGIHASHEVFKVRPKSIVKVYLKKDWKSSTELKGLQELALRNKTKIQEIHPQELDKIAPGHQGLCLEVSETPELDINNDVKLILGLDGVEDPQNLGSIIRTGWLLGLQGIYTLKSRAVGLTPTVAKVASGGAEHVPLDEVNQLIQPIETLKQSNFWVYGLSEKATKTIWDVEFSDRVFLVAGSEEKGLKPQTLKACDELVSIPQIDPSASLNVAVSVAVALSEITRQWRAKS